jgi:hypothetical protein
MNGKSLANQDFEAFKSNMPWFFEPSSTIVLRTHKLRISEEFKQTFPLLTKLVESARVTFLTIDATSYILFAWDSEDGFICGWLNKLEDEDL